MTFPLAKLALSTAVLGSALCHPLAAQSSLERVETLMAQGRAEEARRVLDVWWKEEMTQASAQARQHGLWLRGRLALDGDQAELDFRRLVIEHPGGPYSDEALLRLAQAAHASGDMRAASRHFRSLLRNYPESPLRGEARNWLDRFGNGVAPGEEEAEEEQEGATAGEGSAPAGSGEGSPQEVELPYAVQLGAFSSERRAVRLWERARSADLEPRLVRIPGSGLLRVRVGRFPNSPRAEGLLHRVRALGFEATIVTDALREEPLR